MLKQMFGNSGPLICLRKDAVFLFLRNFSSPASKVSLDERGDQSTTKTEIGEEGKKKPKMTARRAAYQSPARDMLYGIHPVEIALAEKRRTFYRLFLKKRNPQIHEPNEKLDEIQEWAERLKIPIKFSHHKELSYFTNDSVHQGVVLQASQLKFQEWSERMEIFGKTDDDGKLLVYLDGIQDPMNMGALIRSCVFLGVDSILVPNRCSPRLGTVVSKASSGALECAPIYTVSDPLQLMALVRKLNWEVIGTDSDCLPFDKYEITSKNRLLVLGNEGHGVNEDLVNFFTETISVPGVTNLVSSLNVSVTAGILLSHFAMLKRPS